HSTRRGRHIAGSDPPPCVCVRYRPIAGAVGPYAFPPLESETACPSSVCDEGHTPQARGLGAAHSGQTGLNSSGSSAAWSLWHQVQLKSNDSSRTIFDRRSMDSSSSLPRMIASLGYPLSARRRSARTRESNRGSG